MGYIPETLPPVAIEGFSSITGRGVRGMADGRVYFAGNRKFLEENRVEVAGELVSAAGRLEGELKSVIWFAAGHSAIAVAGITDKVKDTSAEAVRRLQSDGTEVYMLTGDSEAAAMAIAGEVGISHYISGVLPQDKAHFIGRLQG